MRKAIGLVTFLIFIHIGETVPVRAGAVIKQVSKTYEQEKEQVADQTIYLDKDKARIDMRTAEPLSVIFRSDRQVLWFINERDASYTEIASRQLEQLWSQMDKAIEQLGGVMKDLTPEQRAAVEQMMRRGSSGATSPATKTGPAARLVARGQSVNGFLCDNYEAYERSLKTKELCVTPWAGLNLEPSDIKTLEEMSKLLTKVTGQLGQELARRKGIPYEGNTELKGLPVKTVGYQKDKISFVTEVKAVHKQDLNDSLFRVPAGYRKVIPKF